MSGKTVFKIKDSVDLFLSNGRYLMVYYMNSRQRKSFRVNNEMIHLLENIDGINHYDELIDIMKEKWDVSPRILLRSSPFCNKTGSLQK